MQCNLKGIILSGYKCIIISQFNLLVKCHHNALKRATAKTNDDFRLDNICKAGKEVFILGQPP